LNLAGTIDSYDFGWLTIYIHEHTQQVDFGRIVKGHPGLVNAATKSYLLALFRRCQNSGYIGLSNAAPLHFQTGVVS